MRYPKGRWRLTFTCGFVIPILWILVTPYLLDRETLVVGIGVVLIAGCYLVIATSAYKIVKVSHQEVPLGLGLFITISVWVIFLFSFYYATFKITEPAIDNLADAFYFSASTFSTLGLGDFVPKETLDRFVVVVQAFLGVSHCQWPVENRLFWPRKIISVA